MQNATHPAINRQARISSTEGDFLDIVVSYPKLEMESMGKFTQNSVRFPYSTETAHVSFSYTSTSRANQYKFYVNFV